MDNQPPMIPTTQPVVIQHNPPSDKPELDIPARIRVAMTALMVLSNKKSTKIAVNDVGIQTIDGDELDIEEKELFHTSAKTLSDYVSGKLKFTKIEEVAHKRHEAQVDIVKAQSTLDTKRANLSVRMDCPMCRNNLLIKANCQFCAGKGTVLVSREED